MFHSSAATQVREQGKGGSLGPSGLGPGASTAYEQSLTFAGAGHLTGDFPIWSYPCVQAFLEGNPRKKGTWKN